MIGIKMIRQAVILAGGEGKRLRPLTLTTPKPLILIHGKPFAEYLIALLKRNSIEEIVFLTGYLGEQFPATLGDGSRFGLSIRYSDSPVDDDTGTRLKKAEGMLDETFLLLYGDNYWPLDLSALLSHHEQARAAATVTVYERQESEEKKNNIGITEGMVTTYDKKRQTRGLTGVDIGFFILERSALDLLPEGNVNFETSVLPALIEKKSLAGFSTRHPYWGLTDIERLPGVERALDPKRKVLFLDRDGTINAKALKADYIKNPEAFVFLPGAVDALAALQKRGFELYIISNQAGIARGAMTEEDLSSIHKKMLETLKKRGVEIRGIYYCPHGWDDGCDCRKPKPGLFFKAAREHDIDLSRASFVGDDDRDSEAGWAAGAAFIKTTSDRGLAHVLPQLIASYDKLTL